MSSTLFLSSSREATLTHLGHVKEVACCGAIGENQIKLLSAGPSLRGAKQLLPPAVISPHCTLTASVAMSHKYWTQTLGSLSGGDSCVYVLFMVSFPCFFRQSLVSFSLICQGSATRLRRSCTCRLIHVSYTLALDQQANRSNETCVQVGTDSWRTYRVTTGVGYVLSTSCCLRCHQLLDFCIDPPL